MTEYPIATTLKIDGVEVPAGLGDIRAGVPTVLDELTVSWGRSSNVDQPDLGSCSFAIREQLIDGAASVPMMDIIGENSTVEVWVAITYPAADPEPETTDSKLIWAGIVQTVSGQIASDHAIEISVTAIEYAAPLAEETIGDDPWPVQTVQTRTDRIMELANTDALPISIDTALAGVELSYRDVDTQPPLSLLQDIAQSAGGVLWLTTTAMGRQVGQQPITWVPRQTLWIENPARRPSLRRFVIDPVTGIVTIEASSAGSMVISAADLLRDPITWVRDKTQEINSVDVTWQRQLTNEDGIPEPASETITVTESPTPEVIKKLSIDTELITAIDALNLANRLLTMAAGPGWVASGFSIDTRLLARDLPDLDYVHRLGVIAQLLDGKLRLGRALTIVDLPGWAPGGVQASVYVEGGTYTFANGAWLLDLNVNAATGQGVSATFDDFAGTGARVIDFDPTIRIRDALGVSGPGAFGDGFGAGPFGEQPFGT